MRSKFLRPVLAGSLLLVGLAAAGTTTSAAAQTETMPADRHDDDGFDKGLLGLIGLAGLLGLRRRNDSDVRHGTPVRDDANRTTAGRV